MEIKDLPIDFSMGDWEVLKCEEYIQGKDLMLEWGSGGSTLSFSSMVKKFVSIEDNEEWYAKVSKHKDENTEIHLVPHHEEILDEELDKNAYDILRGDGRNVNDFFSRKYLGGVEYTSPPDEGDVINWITRGKIDWHCYMNYIKKPLELSYNDYDIILVDGRARAMCGYIAKDLLKDTGYLLFHDFNNRPYYHGILKWFEKVDEEESLAILKLKDNE